MSACDNRALQYVTLSSNHGHSRSLVRRKRSRRRSASVLRTRAPHQSPQEQRARVVVDAVAVVVAWHAEDGVLQHARLIGHYLEVAEVDLGKLGLPFRERLRLKDRPEPCGVLGPRALEAP